MICVTVTEEVTIACLVLLAILKVINSDVGICDMTHTYFTVIVLCEI